VKQASSTASTALKILLGVSLVGLAILFFLPTVRYAGPAAYRNSCQNKMKQLAVAIQNYVDDHGALPPAYTVDADGKPLHSWRTLILPYIEQVELFKSIDLTKPWDDPVNAKARQTVVEEYHCPSLPGPEDSKTTYLAVVTSNSAMQASKRRSVAEITDGASKTLLLVEVDPEHAVPWMSPMDASEEVVLKIGPDSNLAHPGGAHAAFADGHVTFLFDDLPADQRRAIISSAAGDKVLTEE
jgi:prepilin-type processing-associated H-X9-DG protein